MKYDSVIIGAGLSGLTSALLLARSGRRVLVLEQSSQPAPVVRGFTRAGQYFDSGFHYVGGLGKDGAFRPHFRHLGLEDKLELFPFDSQGFDRLKIASTGKMFSVPVGFSEIKAEFGKRFPEIKLEIEKEALKKETDKVSKERLGEITRKLADLNDSLKSLKAQWTLESDTIQKIRQIKEKIDESHAEEQKAERVGNLSLVAELRYGKIVKLEQELEQANTALQEIQANQMMLKEEVEAEDIASIVAKWTGIPVDKLLEGEKNKLLHAEEDLPFLGCVFECVGQQVSQNFFQLIRIDTVPGIHFGQINLELYALAFCK